MGKMESINRANMPNACVNCLASVHVAVLLLIGYIVDMILNILFLASGVFANVPEMTAGSGQRAVVFIISVVAAAFVETFLCFSLPYIAVKKITQKHTNIIAFAAMILAFSAIHLMVSVDKAITVFLSKAWIYALLYVALKMRKQNAFVHVSSLHLAANVTALLLVFIQ